MFPSLSIGRLKTFTDIFFVLTIWLIGTKHVENFFGVSTLKQMFDNSAGQLIT